MSDAPAQPYDKNHPFPARLAENRLLNKPGSAKETRHLVVDIAGSGLSYKVGDSLGVFPANRPEDVEELLAALRLTGDEPVLLPKATEAVPLRAALTDKLSLAEPNAKFLRLLAERAGGASKAKLDALLDPAAAESTKAWLAERHFVDVVQEFADVAVGAQEFAGSLKKLMPRLYSIASSPKPFPTEVHLTVAVVRYQTLGKPRVGVASTYLSDRAGLGAPTVPVFVANSHFGLPEDDSKDVIMVGPGTGVAPFRAFLQERIARGATGRNWLFFGDQKSATDFLYGEEFEAYHRAGQLHRLDCAWSRDQGHKVYVQDKMRAAAAELWQWLSGGAHFYVCGDAKRMAVDVEAALTEVFAIQGGLGPEAAAAHVKQLRKDKIYQKDVY